jgi:hypothetical protein
MKARLRKIWKALTKPRAVRTRKDYPSGIPGTWF